MLLVFSGDSTTLSLIRRHFQKTVEKMACPDCYWPSVLKLVENVRDAQTQLGCWDFLSVCS